ncbi:MAG: type II toxin-antitoxin system VapB family antitoxin [Elusimicrobia bacterium]|nr:type II toxin-antitoxin system VapB family antitoxin [Candidatus Obscuribacterium magneticum]
MKITTYIDGKLLKKALRATGARSQREVLEEGLKNLLADVHRKRFVREFDSFRLTFSLPDLKRARA